jgi:nicotinamidase-related amidase
MALALPSFFDAQRSASVYRVPYQQRADEARAWAETHRLRPAAQDGKRVALLLIDVQNTFCLPEFELFVAGRSGRGAVEDTTRIAELLYRHLDRVTQVIATLDTHSAAQIFHPVFWLDADGRHPAPHTVIRVEDVERGRYRVNPALAPLVSSRRDFDLALWGRSYARQLADGGKYPLVVWPYHSMLGGIGHAMASLVEEAVFFHSIARQSPARMEIKGRHPLTENYSALRPEVARDDLGQPLVPENRALVEHLLAFDEILVAGQAKSHCVAWTVTDLLAEIRARDEALAAKVILLDDCASAVVVPGVVDFTDDAEAAYARFAAAGMRRVTSADWI